MQLKIYIQTIQLHLINTHHEVLKWFDQPIEIKEFRPSDGGWTISEILEHISLTSHYLLILIQKGADKAIRNIHQLSIEELLKKESLTVKNMQRIGVHKAFDWIRPEHMEPSGDKSDIEIKELLIAQLNQCIQTLETLKNGEGLRYKTTMSVDNLGKINVYEYIYFLSQHAFRHIHQMEENRQEWKNKLAE